MGIAAERIASASGNKAGKGSSAPFTKTAMTFTMGTGTGSHPGAWTA